jgi:flagellar motor switch protein FliN
MAQLTAEQIQRIVETCRAHVAELPKTFRAHLECEVALSASEPQVYSVEKLADFEVPGLAVWLIVGEQAVLILLPEALPLPAWYRGAQISEDKRLQTFAHGLSLQMLSKELPAVRYAAVATTSLKDTAQRTQISDSAKLLELTASKGEAPHARILVIVPTGTPSLPAANQTAFPPQAAGKTEHAEEDAAPPGLKETSDELPTGDGSADTAPSAQASLESPSTEPPVGESSAAPGEPAAPRPWIATDETQHAQRILNVPVTVSVLLAERRVPLGQVVGLVPGALVTFNKSCEDLLDLFVNNHRYCQGEAVKIGEHFGLKIVRVGVTEERREHVL